MGGQQDDKAVLEQARDELGRMRGELKLQMHLAGAEARDAWDKLERKWERIEEELGRVGEHAKGPMEEISKATRSLIDEVKQGYARVRDQVRSQRSE